MQRNINSLIGYNLEGTDGEIGKVTDFYFDDDTWTIRYLILQTGNWFSGRDVLISPEALVKSIWKPGIFPVNLTKDQILNSPDIDTDKPVSRQQEIELYGHYLWQPYWGSDFYAGGLWGIPSSAPVIDQKIVKETDENDKRSKDDRHLRSTHEVTGYHIHAIDGEIGHVKDFIMDDRTWQIVWLVVDTHNWIGGKKVLIPVRHIKEVQWENSKVVADETVDSVKNSIAFDGSEFVHPDTVTHNDSNIQPE
jgi:sporulation protein YlmC with PRC-barrel domain